MMEMRKPQTDNRRRSLVAATVAIICNLLSVFIIFYFIPFRIDRREFLDIPDIISCCLLLTPLLVVIVFRGVAEVTFIFAAILFAILAGRIYFLAEFYRFGRSALAPMDVPGLALIALAAASVVILLIYGLMYSTSLIGRVLKRSNGFR